MSLAPRLQGISALAAGDAVVLEVDLKRALGRPAWHVWMVLTKLRAVDGETHVTHAGIQHAKGFVPMKSHAEVDRAMRRLEAAKLVQPIGWVFRTVPIRGGEIELQVYVRNVFGACLQKLGEARRSECAVPTATKAWISRAPRWGGARAGTGPKPKKDSSVYRETYSSTGQRSNAETYSSTGHLGASASIQVQAPIEIMKRSNVRVLTGRGILLPSEEEVHGAESAPVLSSIREEATEVGTVFAGTAPRLVGSISDPIEGVPPFPGHSLVSAALVPPAPKLHADTPTVTQATMLARAYRGAIEKRFGRQKHPILARGDISRSKHFVHLTTFAEELIAHDIAPAAWCIHRIDVWRKLPKSPSRPLTPSITWVFSLDAISDAKRWKFRAEYERGSLGGRMIFSKVHLRLLAIYNAMHADLRRMRKADAVAKHFPNGLYDELVDQARRESAEISYRLSGDVARGRHVW